MARYWLVLSAIDALIKNTISREVEKVLVIMGVRGYTFDIHPDLALVNVREGKAEKMLFVERLSRESLEELLRKKSIAGIETAVS